MDTNLFSKLSSYLQIAIVIFGLLTPALAFIKWCVDKKVSALKDAEYNARLKELSPRQVSLDQKRILAEKLSSIKGSSVALASRLMDGESADFADQISSAFKEAGLNLGSTNRSSLNDLPGTLTIAVTGNGLERNADLIAGALNSAGIICNVEKISENSMSGLLPNTIYVIVGRKRS